MTEREHEPGGIDDEDLPEDLRPGEENPLAEPLADDVDPDDLDMAGGKDAEQGEDHAGDRDGDDDSDPDGTGASDGDDDSG